MLALPIIAAFGYAPQRLLFDRTANSGEFATPLVTFALSCSRRSPPTWVDPGRRRSAARRPRRRPRPAAGRPERGFLVTRLDRISRGALIGFSPWPRSLPSGC
jgi:hypothetical protein